QVPLFSVKYKKVQITEKKASPNQITKPSEEQTQEREKVQITIPGEE
ncbi:4355_t:CDS:1, partial [Gigaspora rosea]